MPRVNIRWILVSVTCIYTSIILITMIMSTQMNTARFGDDINSTIAKTLMNGSSGENTMKINCPKHCVCSRKSDESIIARCHELIDETYSESNIEHFILENANNITIGPQEFGTHGLIHLKSIEILHCRNTIINRTAFDGLPYLVSVRMLFNKELITDQNIFQNNSQLKILNINEYYESKNSCNASTDYLFDAPSLTEFSLSVTNYTCWSPMTFTKMSNLTYLKLEQQNFKLVPGMFAPLQKLVKLEMLHISHINIVKDAFNGTNLQTLILAYSVVTSLTNIHIAGLKHLHIEYNLMENIGRNDFIGMPALEKLEIINSDIERIHEDAFSHLTQLKYLNIGGNKIVSFSDNHLRNNYKLEVLLLAYNEKLKSLPVFKLNSTNNNNYTINEFDCCNCGLESIAADTFNAMPGLTRLTLERNRIKTLPQGLFKRLSSLKSFDLSKNLILNIPDDMFDGAIKLLQLNLAENLLTTLQMTPFLRTPELSGLDVSQCKIKNWNETSTPVKSLRFLSLHGNKLEHITVEQLETVPHLSRLKALENPIKCDDEFNDTIEWLESHHVGTTVDFPTPFYCDSQFDNKSCWNVFQTVLCNLNQISKQHCIEPDHKSGYCYNNTLKTQGIERGISQWCYDNFVLSIVSLIAVLVIIIAITIMNEFCSRTQNLKKCDIAFSYGDSVYEPVDMNVAPSQNFR